jgi:hypothetical protein
MPPQKNLLIIVFCTLPVFEQIIFIVISTGKHTGQSLMAGRRSTGSSPSLNVPSRNITTTKSKDHLASQLSNAASASKK